MHWKTAVIGMIPDSNKKDGDTNPDVVSLLVGEGYKAFFLHKTLLQLTSHKFKKMLAQGKPSYKLPELSPNVFKEVVQYIYMYSEWEFNGSLVDACSLLKVAMDYGLEELAHTIHTKISELSLEDVGLEGNSACFIYEVLRGITFDGGKLKNFVLNYISRNAKFILTLDSFSSLSLNGLLDILCEDDLEVDTELDVYKAVIRWGMNSLEEKSVVCSIDNLQEVLKRPLQCVRFSNMSTFDTQHYVGALGLRNLDDELELDSLISLDDSSSESEDMEGLDAGTHKVIGVFWEEPIGTEAVEKLRKYFRPIRSESLEPTMEEVLRAELYVEKFKAQVEASVWKTTVAELQEDLRKTKAKFQQDIKEAEKTVLLNCEWRAFLREPVGSISSDVAIDPSSLHVIIQNNTDMILHYQRCLAKEGCELPHVYPGKGRRFSVIAKDATDTIMFSYILRINAEKSYVRSFVAGIKMTPVDDFGVGFVNLHTRAFDDNLCSKILAGQWGNQKVGGVTTCVFSGSIVLRATRAEGVLKILFFQNWGTSLP